MAGKVFILLFACIMALQAKRMTYGTGMACSYFEGYLNYILPSNGPDAPGLVENMNIHEALQGTNFPVKKFFIIITKSMQCLPDLQEYNKVEKNRANLEAAEPLLTRVTDMTGALRRSYRTAVYQIRKEGQPPVYVSAECATPLHTLYLAQQNPALAPVFEDVEIDEEVSDFTEALHSLINAGSTYKHKCELVFFDDTDSQQNLADVLLNKIHENVLIQSSM